MDSSSNPCIFFADQMTKVVIICNSVFSRSWSDTASQRLEQALKSHPVSEVNAAVAKETEPFHTKDLPIKNKEELEAFERKMASSPKARYKLASQRYLISILM